MLVLKLCQQLCSDRIPPVIPDRLGDGADGEVFVSAQDPNKVIKFSVLYETGNQKAENSYQNISKVLNYLIENPELTFARVFDQVQLGTFHRPTTWTKKQKYILYYYSMEKLFKISEDEKRVFHSILSHEDRGAKKNFTNSEIKKMLSGMNRGLDFDQQKVIFFCDNFRKVPVQHHDIHVRNIMKDAAGNFKLIDFDRAQLMRRKNNVK